MADYKKYESETEGELYSNPTKVGVVKQHFLIIKIKKLIADIRFPDSKYVCVKCKDWSCSFVSMERACKEGASENCQATTEGIRKNLIKIDEAKPYLEKLRQTYDVSDHDIIGSPSGSSMLDHNALEYLHGSVAPAMMRKDKPTTVKEWFYSIKCAGMDRGYGTVVDGPTVEDHDPLNVLFDLLEKSALYPWAKVCTKCGGTSCAFSLESHVRENRNPDCPKTETEVLGALRPASEALTIMEEVFLANPGLKSEVEGAFVKHKEKIATKVEIEDSTGLDLKKLLSALMEGGPSRPDRVAYDDND